MNNNLEKFNKFRTQYNTFIYKSYEILDQGEEIILNYTFEILGLATFTPKTKILKKDILVNNIEDEFVSNLAFHVGLIELISYWKCTCSPNVIIECGYLNDEQINWFKKLYYYGLGELFYTNGISTSINEFMNITCTGKTLKNFTSIDEGIFKNKIIPIGGGKDSVVTLELIGNTKTDYCLIVNPKPVTLECAKIAGYDQNRIIEVTRIIDRKLIDLNAEGYINGHTPFSSMLAFLSYLIANLSNIQYITLSNESSANESNVVGENINHQYSKSYEFENDFKYYTENYLKSHSKYFSFLRPLNELQIAMLFSKFEKYHSTFKSCNVGSKGEKWNWCCDCPKCLFVFSILSPFLYKDKLVNIFGEDLFSKETLLKTFIELCGYGETKPFECVGTFEEVNFAISKTINNMEKNNLKLPYLLQYYKDHFELFNLENDLTKKYNRENNLPEEFNSILEKEVLHYDK